MWKGFVVKMDDLANWRRKIGCFRGGRPKTRWRCDPYGGRRVLTWSETLFGGLCFLAAVLAAYSFLEEVHQADLRTLVRCHSVLENPGWKRIRGRLCEEDLVGGGLTVGSVWVVAAFSAWGVHELYRRLKLLWGGTIERNPGPLDKKMPEEASGARPTPPKAAETTAASSTSAAPVGLLLVGRPPGNETRAMASKEGIGNNQAGNQNPDGARGGASAKTDSGETVSKKIGNSGDGTGAKPVQKTRVSESGAGEQFSAVHSANTSSTMSGNRTATNESSLPDNEIEKRCADKTTTSGVTQPVTVQKAKSSVCQNSNSDLSERKEGKGREGESESGIHEEGKGGVGGV